MDQKVIEYMRGLVGKTVLHTEYGVVGEVTKLYEPGEYVDGGGNAISKHVLELSNGHTFIAPEEAATIVQLTEHEVQVFMKLTEDLGTLSIGAAMAIRSKAPDRLTIALSLIRSALAAQLRALGS